MRDEPTLDDGPADSPFSSETTDGEPGQVEKTSKGVTDRLFDGSVPGPSIEELKRDYELSHPWAISLRGAIRAATGDGVPPIFEIVFGSSLGILKFQTAGDGNAENGAASGDVSTRFDAEPDSAEDL